MNIMIGFAIGLVIFILAILIIPLIIPITPLMNVTSIDKLADPDSRFINVNGINIHYKKYGNKKPVFILLHGFGASVYSWRVVMETLSRFGTVIAYDRPGFGLTQRPMPGEWQGNNPYNLDAQSDLVIGLMDNLEIDKAILVGNSAGGTVASQTALKYPDRVTSLILVDPAVSGNPSRRWINWVMDLPQVNHLGPLLVRSIAGKTSDDTIRKAWHDPSKVTPEIIAGYRKPLQLPNWDRALWEYTKANTGSDLLAHLVDIRLPVLVITGDDDRIIPTENSISLARLIPGAKLTVLKNCGHVPQEECPQEFLKAVSEFIN